MDINGRFERGCRRVPRVIILMTCLILLLSTVQSMQALAESRKERSTRIPSKPEGNSQLVTFSCDFRFHIKGNVTRLRFLYCPPKTVKERQRVIQINFSPEPVAIYDEGATRYAVFSFGPSTGDQVIKISGEIELYRYDIETAIAVGATRKEAVSMSDSDRAQYLKAERFLEVHDPTVQKVARTIQSSQQRMHANPGRTQEEKMQKAELDCIQDILDWIRQNMQYEEHADSRRGAARAINLGKGVCSEFSDVFVTLCRASGLPAKVIKGLNTYFNNDPTHQWAEVFITGLGWVPFDPTWMHSAFAILRPIYLRQSDHNIGGVDSEGSFQLRYWYGSNSRPQVIFADSYHFYPK